MSGLEEEYMNDPAVDPNDNSNSVTVSPEPEAPWPIISPEWWSAGWESLAPYHYLILAAGFALVSVIVWQIARYVMVEKEEFRPYNAPGTNPSKRQVTEDEENPLDDTPDERRQSNNRSGPPAEEIELADLSEPRYVGQATGAIPRVPSQTVRQSPRTHVRQARAAASAEETLVRGRNGAGRGQTNVGRGAIGQSVPRSSSRTRRTPPSQRGRSRDRSSSRGRSMSRNRKRK